MSISVLTKITYRVLITSWEVMTNPEKPVGETTETSKLQYQDTSPSTGNFAMPAMRRGDQGVQQAVWKWVKMAILETNTDFEMFRQLDMIWIFDRMTFQAIFEDSEMSNPPTFLGAFSASGSQGKWYQQADFLQVFVDCKLNQHNDYHGNSDVFTPPLSKISGFLVPHGQSSLRFRPPHSWQLMPWDRIS